MMRYFSSKFIDLNVIQLQIYTRILAINTLTFTISTSTFQLKHLLVARYMRLAKKSNPWTREIQTLLKYKILWQIFKKFRRESYEIRENYQLHASWKCWFFSKIYLFSVNSKQCSDFIDFFFLKKKIRLFQPNWAIFIHFIIFTIIYAINDERNFNWNNEWNSLLFRIIQV